MTTEIIFSGFGGQGILTTGIITATAATNLGKQVTWYPSYGAQMRGGTANCSVKISDHPIASPYAKRLNILCAMNVPSIEKFQPLLQPGGLLLADGDVVPEEYVFRDDIRAIRIPVETIAAQEKNARGANLVMLGALASNTDLFDLETIICLVDEYFAKKGKNNPLNAACIRAGAAYTC